MAPAGPTESKIHHSKPPKLPRLPKNARVTKRPILRPSIPSPYSGANEPKIVYVSTKTPFIPAVKRIRKLLSEIEKRSMGKIDLINGEGNDKQKLKALAENKNAAVGEAKEREAVILKATNKAIEKLLGLALYFQGQDDCRVRLRTGTVGVVDDIEEGPKPSNGEDAKDEKGKEENEEEDLPETRIRRISMVEAAISIR